MKKLFAFLVLGSSFLFLAAQPVATTHYWSVGLSSSTPFFFATYNPGGSNIFVLDGSYTHVVDRNWLLGGGFGIGGAASPRQVYRTATADGSGFDTLGTSLRNPYVIPVFVRARYIFDPSRKNSWFAGADAGYMLGLVKGQASQVLNYYSAYVPPTLGHRFGFTSTRTRVCVGAGVNFYLEGREAECAPYDLHYDPHLNFHLYVTFDFGSGK